MAAKGFVMNARATALEITRRGVPKVWTDRIEGMLTHIAFRGNPNQPTKQPVGFVSVVAQFPKSWPLKGAIFVTDEEGLNWALWMDFDKVFQVKPARLYPGGGSLK